ncbi:MAG: tetratricopeptide repeat-containing protein kinase family protein, partial [Dokdonella sp.]
SEWTARHLDALPDQARIALFLQVVDAVVSAHSVGVLHKDLKPANVLVSETARGPHVRLTDFGSGRLLDPDHLVKLGITRLGMTVTESVATDAGSGTPIYVAPEVFAGQTPTVQSDVYALGIVLYQMLSGRIGQPMVSGWEQNIVDALLRDDIRLATDGNPERRLASAAELATRLRHLEARRDEAARSSQRDAEAQQIRAALSLSRARRPMVWALMIVLTLGIGVAVVLQQLAVRSSNEARDELMRATAITRFVNEDLIGRSNPLVSAKGAEATLREVLLAARSRVAARFAEQPGAEAAIRLSLANLFNTIDLWQDAEVEVQLALALYERIHGPRHIEALRARSLWSNLQSRLGRPAEAEKTLAELARLTAEDDSETAQYLRASAASALAISRGDYAAAARELKIAVSTLNGAEPDNTVLSDQLRINLIACEALAGDVDASKVAAESLIKDASMRSDDAGLTIALAKMAVARAHGEDHEAVEALLLAAHPVIVERLGDNHSRHLQLLGELLALALRRGDLDNGVRYAETIYQRARGKFGDRHPTTFVTLTNWGRLLYEAGQPAEAAIHLREAHAKLLALAGTPSAQTQDAGQVLAAVELELGNAAAAASLIAELDADILEAGRATGVWPAVINALRGILLLQQGDAEAARPLLVSALQVLASEAELDQPGRLYVLTREALATLQQRAPL